MALSVQAPFSEARIMDDELYVRLAPGVPLSTVVFLSTGPLTPGMQLGEARALLGAPSSTRTDAIGTYYSFAPTLPVVELAHLVYEDSGPIDTWVLVAAPEGSTLPPVLSPDLQALVTRAGGINELIVHERTRPALKAFTARIRDGGPYKLQWYSIEGIPGG
jgi:hypothetical protein